MFQSEFIPSESEMSKQQKRLESKKRKVQAFLDLVSKESSYLDYSEKRFKTGSYDTEAESSSSLASLRAEVRAIQKRRGPPPSFELLGPGIQAQVNIEKSTEDTAGHSENAAEQINSVPLYIGDVQQFLLKAILNTASTCRPRWCSLERGQLVDKVLLVVVEGLGTSAVLESASQLKSITTVFSNMVEIVTPYKYTSTFASEFCELSLSFCYEVCPNSKFENWRVEPCNTHKSLASIVPVQTSKSSERDPNEGFSRLHLLLSPMQMVMENFPLPQGVFECVDTTGYMLSQDIYSPVTAKSPIFAVDCEMCRVVSGRMEVTHVAVVNEELETVYSTLVKPTERIVDYVTRFSGVTEQMLRPVTTRLEDVQNHIRQLLTPDAILCGQSLNFDLHALRMVHPYVIDTSVIYNTTSIRSRKTGLKTLSSMFLKEKIQNSEAGHHPVEDCIATMKLVKLKLQNGPQFGDSVLSSKFPLKTEDKTVQNVSGNSHVQESEEERPKDNITSFFTQFPAEKKRSVIIVREHIWDQYSDKMLNEAVSRKIVSSNKKVLKHTLTEMSNHNLTISHFSFPRCSNSSNAVVKVDGWVEKLYEALSKNSVFILVGTGLKNNEKCENGFCQVLIKT